MSFNQARIGPKFKIHFKIVTKLRLQVLWGQGQIRMLDSVLWYMGWLGRLVDRMPWLYVVAYILWSVLLQVDSEHSMLSSILSSISSCTSTTVSLHSVLNTRNIFGGKSTWHPCRLWVHFNRLCTNGSLMYKWIGINITKINKRYLNVVIRNVLSFLFYQFFSSQLKSNQI